MRSLAKTGRRSHAIAPVEDVWLILAVSILLSLGCKGRPLPTAGADQGSAAKTTGSAAGPESETSKSAEGASSASTPPLTLAGVYTMGEIEADGRVTMVPRSFATTITFMSDGSYSRNSSRAGVVDHSDSGKYRIEGNDQLILVAIFSDKRAIKNAPEKRHTFSLSPDGLELRLSGSPGKTAVFRRTASPAER